MTQPQTLGVAALRLDVLLNEDASFVATLVREDGTDWGVTDEVKLVFSDGTEWPADLTGPNASWAMTPVEVNALLDVNPSWVELWYTDTAPGGATARWTRGYVNLDCP